LRRNAQGCGEVVQVAVETLELRQRFQVRRDLGPSCGGQGGGAAEILKMPQHKNVCRNLKIFNAT
jgi:hypothetical protein